MSKYVSFLCNTYLIFAAMASGPAARGPTFEAEEDPEKVVNNCCGANIYEEGEEIELKPHSEYPDWLWELRTEKGAPELSEIEYGSDQYWRRYRQLSLREKNVLTKLKRKKKIIKVK